MSTAVIASAAAGGLLGGLVVYAGTKAKKRAAERRLLRRLEAAFTRLIGPAASSVFDAAPMRPEIAVERIEEAAEFLETSKSNALDSYSAVCRALDEMPVPVAVYTVAGECLYENRAAKVLLSRRFSGSDLKARAEALVSKSLWSGESLSEEVRPDGARDRSVSIRVSPLDGEKKRLGIVVFYTEEFAREELDLLSVCRRAASEVTEAAFERSVTITVYEPNAATAPSPVSGSRDALTEAARCLIENSISVAHPGSVVEIGAARVRGETWLWVADEAPGASERVLEEIFEPTETGADLSIVRYVADLHAAELEARVVDGIGRRFTLRFPATRGESPR